MNPLRVPTILLGIGIGVGFGLILVAAMLSPAEVELSNFTTSLHGRTKGQRHNVRLSCEAINGCVVLPGQTFSFNSIVGAWNQERGYTKAPVSFGGEMVLGRGGGVCQVSSTLYNAALLAGMKIVERHHHVWPSKYIPPGRDAAVAYGTADLRFQNPHPYPVRVVAVVKGETLLCQLMAKTTKAPQKERFVVTEEVEAVLPPVEVIHFDRHLPHGRKVVVNYGQQGYRVRVYRTTLFGNREVRRELISDDYYKPMNRIVKVGVR